MTFLSRSVYLLGKITWDERVSVGILEKRLLKNIRETCEKSLQKGTMHGRMSLSNVKKLWEWRKKKDENVLISCPWKKYLLFAE